MQCPLDNDLQARDYQINLVHTALEQNTIIYLPTGAGKTFIAVMILRQLGEPLKKSISEGGKISVMLVNTHALINQQSRYLRRFTPFQVLEYHSQANGGKWWKRQMDNHEILVITPKAFMFLLQSSFLNLKNVNLLIFDECHRAVNNHPMKKLMDKIKALKEPPRIIGLTATLLNGNCALKNIIDEVKTLEVTLSSKIATAELQQLDGFSTNPKEILKTFDDQIPVVVSDVIEHLKEFTYSTKKMLLGKKLKYIIKIIEDIIIQIETFGIFGGKIAVITRIAQMKMIKENYHDKKMCNILDSAVTTLQVVQKMLETEMLSYNEKNWVYKFSTQKVHALLNILQDYHHNSKELLCGIVFVKRRFTATILYNILIYLKTVDSQFKDIYPNFVLGTSRSSNNVSLQFSYATYKKTINQFHNKEINLLIASNVLEEGVDLPICNLVINFDITLDYRAYIQLKGRARHNNSLYYLMVGVNTFDKFKKDFELYKATEKILNNHLISRFKRDDEKVLEKSHQTYTKASGLAEIDLVTGEQFFEEYCLSVHSNDCTTFIPTWHLEKKEIKNKLFQKIIMQFPTLESIEGPYMKSVMLAKRTTALKVHELLYKDGELDDNLFLKQYNTGLEQCKHLFFKHWPNHEELSAGSSNLHRRHHTRIPDVLKGQVQSNTTVHLHVIELKPTFSHVANNITQSMMHEIYSSQLGYGVVTAQTLPQLCEFPIYVSTGEIIVNCKVNQKQINLSVQQIVNIRLFHYLIFKEILQLVQNYLVYDNDKSAEILLLVPIQKKDNDYSIDFDIICENQKLQHYQKNKKKVAEEYYLKKIVTTASNNKKYLVTSICSEAVSSLEEPTTLASCSNDKYHTELSSCGKKPMLLAKPISEQINNLKPQSDTENVQEEYLRPEQCIVQHFPSILWIQTYLLPTILYRMTSLIQTEELRRKIAMETGLGVVNLNDGDSWLPLVLDKQLFNYTGEEFLQLQVQKVRNTEPKKADVVSPITAMQLNQEALYNTAKLYNTEQNLHSDFTDIKWYEDYLTQHAISTETVKKNEMTTNTKHIPTDNEYVYKNVALLESVENERGPELVEVFRALTLAKSKDIVNLERMETLGDSFLKFSISLFVILKYPENNSGESSTFRGQLASNKNLYYIGIAKKIDQYLKSFNITDFSKWKPPCFTVANQLQNKINENKAAGALIDWHFSNEEQVSGILELQQEQCIEEFTKKPYREIDQIYESMCGFSKICNKSISDSVEALLAVYFQSCGFIGGLKLLQWLEIIPESENIENLLNIQPPNPLLIDNANDCDIDCLLPVYNLIEEKLGYRFKNRAYLLQAFTHSSYTPNYLTKCYKQLEFLGDAVLDFLITCHIYETCQTLNPGQLTDLRSALVNNITFASFTVRCGFHKFILFSCDKLLQNIDNFVHYQESKNLVINDEDFILLEENDLYLAEQVDVPKILGDIFEALAAAVYLDSGLNLETVWKVFYHIMWKEIELFSHNIPKNVVRLLHETVNAQPKYHEPIEINTGGIMAGLDFTLHGTRKTVYGFGKNKFCAKKAAAKIALRLLQ